MKFLFFNSRYLNNYFVYNLSGIDYDRSKFNNNVEERRALFEKEYQKVVEVNNRVNAANKWKKKNVINGEAKCVFGNALNDIKKTICGQ